MCPPVGPANDSPSGAPFDWLVEFAIDSASIPAHSTLTTASPTIVNPAGAAAGGFTTTDHVAEPNPTAALPANIGVAGARISAANVISVTLINPTAAPIDPASITFRARIRKA